MRLVSLGSQVPALAAAVAVGVAAVVDPAVHTHLLALLESALPALELSDK